MLEQLYKVYVRNNKTWKESYILQYCCLWPKGSLNSVNDFIFTVGSLSVLSLELCKTVLS